MSNSAKRLYEDRNFKRKRLRRYLRAETHWKNPNEFYLAVLFECGAPPHPIDSTYISSNGRLICNKEKWAEMANWHVKVASMVNEKLYWFNDPAHVVREYLKWLLREQEQGRIRISGL